MKNLFYLLVVVLLITTVFISKVNGSDNLSTMNHSEIDIGEKYSQNYCNAKDNNLFEGLNNEKDLKYSYFRYIGSQEIAILKNDTFKRLISQIKEKCKISNDEENELVEFFKNELMNN